jgi:hypothetical protein
MLLRERREALGGPPAALCLHAATEEDEEDSDAVFGMEADDPQQQAALQALVARELGAMEGVSGRPAVRAASSDADLRRVMPALMEAVAVQAAGEQAVAMLCELAGLCDLPLPPHSIAHTELVATSIANSNHTHQ